MRILKETFKNDNNARVSLPAIKAEGFQIIYSDKENISEDLVQPVYEGSIAIQQPFSASEIHEATVVDACTHCLPKKGFKAIYELSFDVTESTISRNFEPGDTIAVLPVNDKREVDLVLERLGLSNRADTLYDIHNKDEKGKSQIPKHVPIKSTLRYTLGCCIDLRSVVKKVFIRALSSYCSLQEEKKCLEHICSREGSELYTKYILNRRTSLLDILNVFTSCRPSIVCVLSHLPRLFPRPYSIVNSRLTDGNIVKICFSVQTLENGIKGLVTTQLEKLAIQFNNKNNGDIISKLENLKLGMDTTHIYLRKNMGFTFPDEEENVLLIGPGTGVAPFIGFLEKRRETIKESPSLNQGAVWLFYGCRDENVDFIYKEELNEFLKDGVLKRLNTACSRMENIEIKYVQDSLKENAEEVGRFLTDDSAYVYVCGDISNMAKQVEAVLIECVQHTGRTLEQSEEFVKCMQANKKYLVDVWC